MDLEPTKLTWFLLIFGWIFVLLVLLLAQTLMLLHPNSKKAKEIQIGKGESWRDKTHQKSAKALAIADLLFWLPLLAAGSAGVVMGELWGYVLWVASGVVSIYISVFLWFFEKEYVYPKAGLWQYYTYVWGFFIYWGLATVVHALAKIA